jgi:hypothetical protein
MAQLKIGLRLCWQAQQSIQVEIGIASDRKYDLGSTRFDSLLVFGFVLGEKKRGAICVMTSSWMVRIYRTGSTGLIQEGSA